MTALYREEYTVERKRWYLAVDPPEAKRTVNQPRGERHRTAAEARRHVPPLHSPIAPRGTRPLFFTARSVVSRTNYTCMHVLRTEERVSLLFLLLLSCVRRLIIKLKLF